jgi:heme-degrading monooxygenase HmoA
MIAVIFEVWPRGEESEQEYLDIAAQLRPQLDTIEGFISIERFESLTSPGKFLSLSFWRDEQAVEIWRQRGEHRVAQERGRAGIFQDYRLRVVDVIRDYGMFEREQAPGDSRQLHG